MRDKTFNSADEFASSHKGAHLGALHRHRPHVPVLLACFAYIGLRIHPTEWDWLIALVFAAGLLVWLVFNLAFIVTRPAQRKARLINIVLWALAIMLVALVNDTRVRSGRDEARRQADVVVTKVQAYRLRTGNWPPDLAAAGVDERTIAAREVSYSRLKSGGAEMYYRDLFDDNFMGVTFYVYDFERNSWRHIRD